MNTLLAIHSFVRNKNNGLEAQVYKHFIAKCEAVGVIISLQPGFSSGMDRYDIWWINDMEQIGGN